MAVEQLTELEDTSGGGRRGCGSFHEFCVGHSRWRDLSSLGTGPCGSGDEAGPAAGIWKSSACHGVKAVECYEADGFVDN